MLEVPYGEGRALMGGAVYRYRCTAGEMEGSDTVVCTGAQWNTSRPHCNGRKPVRQSSDFSLQNLITMLISDNDSDVGLMTAGLMCGVQLSRDCRGSPWWWRART